MGGDAATNLGTPRLVGKHWQLEEARKGPSLGASEGKWSSQYLNSHFQSPELWVNQFLLFFVWLVGLGFFCFLATYGGPRPGIRSEPQFATYSPGWGSNLCPWH